MPTGSEARLALPFANKEPAEPVGSARRADREGSDVLAALARDTGPAADAIRKLLDDPSPEAAAALLKDLPNLIPDDPALAAVIADAMAEEFGKTIANKEGECRAADPSKCSVHGSGAKSDKAKAKAAKRERQSSNKAHGVAAMVQVSAGGDCRDFMRSEQLERQGDAKCAERF